MNNGVLCATEREALTALLRGGVSPFTAKKALDLAARKGGASIYFGGGRRCFIDIVSRPDPGAEKKIMVVFDDTGTSTGSPPIQIDHSRITN